MRRILLVFAFFSLSTPGMAQEKIMVATPEGVLAVDLETGVKAALIDDFPGTKRLSSQGRYLYVLREQGVTVLRLNKHRDRVLRRTDFESSTPLLASAFLALDQQRILISDPCGVLLYRLEDQRVVLENRFLFGVRVTDLRIDKKGDLYFVDAIEGSVVKVFQNPESGFDWKHPEPILVRLGHATQVVLAGKKIIVGAQSGVFFPIYPPCGTLPLLAAPPLGTQDARVELFRLDLSSQVLLNESELLAFGPRAMVANRKEVFVLAIRIEGGFRVVGVDFFGNIREVASTSDNIWTSITLM